MVGAWLGWATRGRVPAGPRVRVPPGLTPATPGAGGELVEQEATVALVASPWALDLAETPRFFVPGAPFTLLVSSWEMCEPSCMLVQSRASPCAWRCVLVGAGACLCTALQAPVRWRCILVQDCAWPCKPLWVVVHPCACLCEAVQGLGNTRACSCKGVHSCAHLCKALCTSWCEHCSPQGRVLHAGGEPAPGIGVRVTVGVTGATSPRPIEFRADTTGAIVIPINVPRGATALDLSVSGDTGTRGHGGTWGDIGTWEYGDMGTWGDIGTWGYG